MKNIYFLSDAHLGSRLVDNPRAHELRLVQWLESVKTSASIIYLLGDIFDFWFEYKTVVPKGFVRFFGKLAEMIDAGIEIRFFIGNHDIWAFEYFEREIGMKVYRKPGTVEHSGKIFYLRHGDGLQSDDKGFRFISKIFHNKTAQAAFRCIPPQLGQNFGYQWAKHNRLKEGDNQNFDRQSDPIFSFANEYSKTHAIDYFVFGHRHIPVNIALDDGSRLIVLGDFINHFTFGTFDGTSFLLDKF